MARFRGLFQSPLAPRFRELDKAKLLQGTLVIVTPLTVSSNTALFFVGNSLRGAIWTGYMALNWRDWIICRHDWLVDVMGL